MNLITIGLIASVVAIGSGAGLLMLGNPEMETRAVMFLMVGGFGLFLNGSIKLHELRKRPS